MAIADFADRWRIFFVGSILSIWIFVIDGLNYSMNWSDDQENEVWAKVVVLITGYLFCVPTFIGCFMVLVWANPKTGAMLVVVSSFVCGTARLIATILGFKDFWQEDELDSTTSGTTDVAIAAFQLYLLFDAFNLYRFASRQEEKGYIKVMTTDEEDPELEEDDRKHVHVNEETQLSGTNPFDHAPHAYD
mmetsp:Transcript_73885/g.117770  ORF Transcript_73885/g.117770 Transcript_73885/m.117770 type:complete len:190 (+) Transcript_73885:27-596(+)|eukprot:CAMPEP_0197032100 /NCGR_PEP_ID=MMETSP1384-20130603/10857_1 /TAXON_ID=29189 /ORGANISM="Ammonia sp." /LENGTH=189 /DNA_ID=CAMNT_0042461705 /DNA_START=25 /DNA_END=594 /DNA_ORIENTATION=+